MLMLNARQMWSKSTPAKLSSLARSSGVVSTSGRGFEFSERQSQRTAFGGFFVRRSNKAGPRVLAGVAASPVKVRKAESESRKTASRGSQRKQFHSPGRPLKFRKESGKTDVTDKADKRGRDRGAAQSADTSLHRVLPQAKSTAKLARDRRVVDVTPDILEETTAERSGASKILLGQTSEDLQELAASLGLPSYRGKQLYDGLTKGAKQISDISNIPKALQEKLASGGYTTGRSLLQNLVVSKDGTRKLLLKLHDGRVIEAVGIPNERDSRLTACISSQVGCPLRCSFCATGKGGFARNLQAHEIIDQVLAVQEQFGDRVSNVVFMGMGEPLLNLRSVLAANRYIVSEIGIGARHVTISTVGVPNAIMKLASHKLQSTLAISIHAPDQALRETIVPSAKVYPLEALMLDCCKYFEVTGRRITFEYTLLAGVNDGTVQATQLAKLLRRFNLRAHVNIIPWNPVDESDFQRPTRATVNAFVAALDAAGVTNSVRITRGLEAAAACGQLRNEHQKVPVAAGDAQT